MHKDEALQDYKKLPGKPTIVLQHLNVDPMKSEASCCVFDGGTLVCPKDGSRCSVVKVCGTPLEEGVSYKENIKKSVFKEK